MSAFLFRILCCSALCTAAVFGQKAQLSGVVTDQNGGVIAAARVEVRNTETGLIRSTSTTDGGDYTLPSLPVGVYNLQVRKEGFRTLDRRGLALPVETNVRLDLSLELGEVAQTVVVESAAPVLQETPEIATSVTSRDYQRLPLVQISRMRSPASFVFLSAGVQGTVQLNGTDNTAASNQVMVHGASNQTSEYWIEGLPAGKSNANFNESAPSVDAVREFRLLTSQLSAEYGNTGAAVTSYTMRSGTNQLHGSAYDYFRNDKLDARTWLAETRPPVRLNEFGVTVGGPVLIPRLYDGRNRTFFFFAYGGSRKRGLDQFSRVTVPTATNRGGDFSALRTSSGALVPIYDPATSRISNGVMVRDQFPGNAIPQSRFDPVASKILTYFPEPNTAGTLNYGQPIGEKLLDPDSWTGKLDHSFTDRHRLALLAVRTYIPRVRPDNPLPEPIVTGNRQLNRSWTVRANYDAILTPSILNSFYAGMNRFHETLISLVPQQDWSSVLGLSGISNRAFPVMSFAGVYAQIGSGAGTEAIDWTGMVKDNLSVVRGAHSLKFGAEWRYNQINNVQYAGTNGSWSFAAALTGDPGRLTGTGDPFASFLLGGASGVSGSVPVVSGQRKSYGGLFAQDEWRVRPNLTLIYGLRWELQTAPYENHDRSSAVDLLKPNPLAGNRPGAMVYAGTGPNRTGGRAFLPNDLSAFGPRVGLAWRLLPKTALRGGAGLYYSNAYSSISSLGFSATTSQSSQDAGITAVRQLSAGLPPLVTITSLTPEAANGLSATYYEAASAAMPRTYNWSLSVQHQFSEAFWMEASYVGLRSVRQRAELLANLNQVDPKYLALGALLTRPVTSAEAVAQGISVPYAGFTGTVAQALRLYPQYQSLTSNAAKLGESTYHAMELRARKRFQGGLSFEANYTWSKHTGLPDTSNIGFGGVANYLQDHYNLAAEHSLMPNDTPHSVVLNYVYELPFGAAGRSRLVRTVAGGWSVSGVHRYQTGTPLQLTMNNTLPLFNRVLRPDLLSGASVSSGISNGDFQPNTDRIANLAAFAVPGAYRFGTAPPTTGGLRNFNVLHEDLALTKHIALHERASLELYGQAYNVLNRHRFANFDTNYSSASFGRPRAVSLPRFIQLGVRLRF